jgi:hypothetical protein
MSRWGENGKLAGGELREKCRDVGRYSQQEEPMVTTSKSICDVNIRLFL